MKTLVTVSMFFIWPFSILAQNLEPVTPANYNKSFGIYVGSATFNSISGFAIGGHFTKQIKSNRSYSFLAQYEAGSKYYSGSESLQLIADTIYQKNVELKYKLFYIGAQKAWLAPITGKIGFKGLLDVFIGAGVANYRELIKKYPVQQNQDGSYDIAFSPYRNYTMISLNIQPGIGVYYKGKKFGLFADFYQLFSVNNLDQVINVDIREPLNPAMRIGFNFFLK